MVWTNAIRAITAHGSWGKSGRETDAAWMLLRDKKEKAEQLPATHGSVFLPLKAARRGAAEHGFAVEIQLRGKQISVG